jgi:hypothetical protein
MKESYNTIEESITIPHVNIGLNSKSEKSTSTLSEMAVTYDEASELLTPRSRSFTGWGTSSFVPSLGCTRCYRCKELGHTAKNCNYISSISSSVANTPPKPTSNMVNASLPHEIQKNMGIKIGIAEGLGEKKEDEGISVQAVNLPSIKPSLDPTVLSVFNGSLQIVNPSNLSLFNSRSATLLPAEILSKSVLSASTNVSPTYLSSAFNNIGVKSTESYALRYQESLKVYPEAQIVWQ